VITKHSIADLHLSSMLLMLLRKRPGIGGCCTKCCQAKENLAFLKFYFVELYMNNPITHSHDVITHHELRKVS
jgi:hypothetical protein